MNDALTDVQAERERQNAKWGVQSWPDGTGPRWIYSRDRAQAMTDQRAMDGDVTWQDILLEEVYEAFAEADPAKLRTELIQVAAVATQWAEAIDLRQP